MTLRVTAVRKFADDEHYDRVLDMFEATYPAMASIDEEEGSRVYLLDAEDGASAGRRVSAMLDQANIAGWADHISAFNTRAA